MSYGIETYNITKKYPETKGYGDLLLHPFRRKEATALSNVNIQIKKEFNTDKRYVMKLKSPETGLLEKIYRMAPVKKVTKIPDGSLSDTIQIEVENIDGNEGIFLVIKEVVDMGARYMPSMRRKSPWERPFPRSWILKISGRKYDTCGFIYRKITCLPLERLYK